MGDVPGVMHFYQTTWALMEAWILGHFLEILILLTTNLRLSASKLKYVLPVLIASIGITTICVFAFGIRAGLEGAFALNGVHYSTGFYGAIVVMAVPVFEAFVLFTSKRIKQ